MSDLLITLRKGSVKHEIPLYIILVYVIIVFSIYIILVRLLCLLFLFITLQMKQYLTMSGGKK